MNIRHLTSAGARSRSTLALKHFAEAVGAGPRKRIVLVLDRAGITAMMAATVLPDPSTTRASTIQHERT
jgi:hypothetical protein